MLLELGHPWKRQNHKLNQTAIPSPTRWTQAKVEDSSRPQPTTIVLTKSTVTLQNYLKPRKDQRQFSFQNLVTIRSKIYIPNTKINRSILLHQTSIWQPWWNVEDNNNMVGKRTSQNITRWCQLRNKNTSYEPLEAVHHSEINTCFCQIVGLAQFFTS